MEAKDRLPYFNFQGKIKHEIKRCFTKANRQDKC